MSSEKKEDLNNSQTKKKGDDDEETGKRLGWLAAAQPTAMDPRINWFDDRVIQALKIKSEKWKKMLALPENV